MTYPDYSTPETWSAGLVAVDEEMFEVRVQRCRRIPPLQAACRAEASRLNNDTRAERIARLNQRIADLRE